jgi:hypothetical protein
MMILYPDHGLGLGFTPRRSPLSISARGIMKTLLKILFFLLLAAIAGGVVFLATWDMPAPTAKVEKVIPNERFQK